jgi:hypothetical protein
MPRLSGAQCPAGTHASVSLGLQAAPRATNGAQCAPVQYAPGSHASLVVQGAPFARRGTQVAAQWWLGAHWSLPVQGAPSVPSGTHSGREPPEQ